MRTVRIEKDKILLDGEIADISLLNDKSEFLASLMTLDIELAENITIHDLVHIFYDLKSIIKGFLSEEYESVAALCFACVLPRQYKEIRIYKSFKIEQDIFENNQNFICLIPEIEFISANNGESGYTNISSLPVIIDENIKLEYESHVIESKTKLNFMDLMVCLFDELPSLIKDGTLFSN